MKSLPSFRGFYPLALLPLLSGAVASCAQAQGGAPLDAPAIVSTPGMGAAILTGGTSILPANGLTGFRVSGGAGVTTTQTVRAVGQPFSNALRVTVSKKPQRDYSIRLVSDSFAPVAKGDVLVAIFWMRGLSTKDEGGAALSAFVFESNAPTNLKSADVTLEAPLGNTWKKFQLPFAAKEDYAAGAANVHFRLGMAEQAFEIGGLSVVNYAQTVKLSDFPRKIQTYPGREANAPWRAAADARIDKIRKGDLQIEVVDAAGKPVRGAKIEVRMKKHAFGFGSVVNTGRLARAPKTEQEVADQKRYREMFAQMFNISVDEGSHKWPAWDNPTLRGEVMQTVAWMNEHEIKMRGHVMVWPAWSNLPKNLKTGYESIKAEKGDEAAKTYLRDAVHAHILDIGRANAGKVVGWDVVNETYTNNDLQTILGHEALVDWFKWAKEADPNARLSINENTILPHNGTKRDFYESEIQFLLDHGAPLEGIGMQGHFGPLASPDELDRTLNRFDKFGLPIQVTEFDYGLPDVDPQLQADYTRDFYTTMFANPHVTDILMWGFWEGAHWRPYKALWNKDWSIKPNGQAWLDLVFKKWWTNADGASDAAGQYQVRGFAGDYEITVTKNAQTQTLRAALPVAGQTVRFVLK